MVHTLLFFLTAVAVPAVWCQINPTPPCQGFLDSCVSNPNSAFLTSINNYNFTAACSSLNQVSDCYNQATLNPVCTNFTQNINTMNASNVANLNLYCPNGAPNECLIGLRNCSTNYNMMPKTSVAQRCNATKIATSCLQALSCPPNLNSLVNTFQQDISQNTTMSSCAQNDPNVGPCERHALACLDPIEKQIQADEQSFNFTHLCGVWPNAMNCFKNLLTDANCTVENSTLQTRITSLTTRYHQYCDANDKPMSCLQALQNCTAEYQLINTLPQFRSDALYMCQGTQRLMTCLGKVDADLSSCKGISSVQGIANFQQKQAEVQQACSKILTTCTTVPSNCVVTQDLRIAKAAENNQAGEICTMAGELQKCLDPYLNRPDCRNNSMLQFENSYASRLSAGVCHNALPMTSSRNTISPAMMISSNATPRVSSNTSVTGSKNTTPLTGNTGGDATILSVSTPLLILTTLWQFV